MASQVHRLFFALRPPSGILCELERAIAELQATGEIRGRWLKLEKLHLTLQFLGDFSAAEEIVQRAKAAGGKLHAGSFRFVLDRAETFARRFDPPCVLRCKADSEAELRDFFGRLGEALQASGLGDHLQTRPYVPHLTVAYAERKLAKPIAIRPIAWQADDFCLIDSLVGSSTHAELARWPLRT